MLLGNDLNKQYNGVCALHSATVRLHPGSTTMLLGRNGSGKARCSISLLCQRRRTAAAGRGGGQRRRANLAAALTNEPRYLLLDEPFAGLDENSERRVLTLLGEYAKNGCGILIASHQPRLLRGLAEQAIVLERGEVTFYGTAEDYSSALKEREL